MVSRLNSTADFELRKGGEHESSTAGETASANSFQDLSDEPARPDEDGAVDTNVRRVACAIELTAGRSRSGDRLERGATDYATGRVRGLARVSAMSRRSLRKRGLRPRANPERDLLLLAISSALLTGDRMGVWDRPPQQRCVCSGPSRRSLRDSLPRCAGSEAR